MTTYTKREARILIDGTDRTAACVLSKSRIEDVITSQVSSASFTLYRHLDDADFGLDLLQEVLVVNPADPGERYFGGVIRAISDYEEGDYIFYELDVVDFSWWLEHPQALVDGTYTNQTDAAIIADFMASTNPDIDASTYVDNVGSITEVEFDNATARAALEELAKRVGAEWYVDYNKKLHWFEATAASAETAPVVLTDGTGGGHGGSTRIPYKNLKRTREAPEATKVEVEGAGSVTATVTGTPVNGKHLVTKIVNRDITDATQASALGQAVLDELGTAPAYTCTIYEPGLRSGMWVQLISNRRAIDASYIVNRVTTGFLTPDGQLQMQVELGQFVPTLPEIIADVQQTVSGGSKAGSYGGGAGGRGVAARGHGHTGGADGPRLRSGSIDPSAPIEGDKLAITLDGVSWPSGNPGNIDLDSPNATITIIPDDANKKISLDVAAGVYAYGTVRGDSGSADAASAGDTLKIAGSTYISTTAADGAPDTITITYTGHTGHTAVISGYTDYETLATVNCSDWKHYHTVDSHYHTVTVSRRKAGGENHIHQESGGGWTGAPSYAIDVLVPYDIQYTSYNVNTDSQSPDTGIPAGTDFGTPPWGTYHAVVDDTQHRHSLTDGVANVTISTS